MKLLAILCTFLFVSFGCSGSDDPEEPITATSEDDDESDAVNNAELTETDDAADVVDIEDAPVEEVEEVASASEEPAGFAGPRVWKYVTSFALNVRNAPDKDNSAVIRHVKWGDKVHVVINGEWAQIGVGEYISAKFLSDTDPALKQRNAVKKKRRL